MDTTQTTKSKFLLIDYHNGGFEVFGPLQTDEQVEAERKSVMDVLEPGDKWYVMVPIEMGEQQ